MVINQVRVHIQATLLVLTWNCRNKSLILVEQHGEPCLPVGALPKLIKLDHFPKHRGLKEIPKSSTTTKIASLEFWRDSQNKIFWVAGFPRLDFCSSNDTVVMKSGKTQVFFSPSKKNGGCILKKKTVQTLNKICNGDFGCFGGNFSSRASFRSGSKQRGAIVLLYTPSRSRLCLRLCDWCEKVGGMLARQHSGILGWRILWGTT